MATQPFKSLLHWLSSASGKRKSDGFTLAELLVGMVIASLITSGLLYLINQILEVSQTESSQTQTQQEMQRALDFISSELREAVYVYQGNCIQGSGAITNTDTFCPGIVNHININTSNNQSNSLPILAFWKLNPLPAPVRTVCQTLPFPTGAAGSRCAAGKTYSLVVYFFRKNLASDNPKWSGKARITRHELSQYVNNTTTLNTFFVAPDLPGVGFQIWPYQVQTNAIVVNLQPTGQLPSDPDTLVDFVDDVRSTDTGTACLDSTNYSLTPTAAANIVAPFNGVRSLYACVRNNIGDTASSSNKDVLIFLRGNASGKAGITNNKFLPTLQTQVLNRGVVDKTPAN